MDRVNTLEELTKALEQPIVTTITKDGSIIIDWPNGRPVDMVTARRVAAEAVQAWNDMEARKSPAQSGNSEQGSPLDKGESDRNYGTPSAANRQELLQILQQLPAEDVEEITQHMRELIEGKA